MQEVVLFWKIAQPSWPFHPHQHATVLCSVLCCATDLLYSWLFSVMVVNKNSLNYCSSSDKSKRRTKTVKKSLEPKWNQTFMYSPVHRREFRERMLEITLWDQARVREEESEFLGEVREPNLSHQGHSLTVSQLSLLNGAVTSSLTVQSLCNTSRGFCCFYFLCKPLLISKHTSVRGEKGIFLAFMLIVRGLWVYVLCCCNSITSDMTAAFSPPVKDPDRAGDGSAGRRATLVQATNTRCILHPTPTCLPEHAAQAAPWRESNEAAAEYVTSLSHHSKYYAEKYIEPRQVNWCIADIWIFFLTAYLMMSVRNSYQIPTRMTHSSMQTSTKQSYTSLLDTKLYKVINLMLHFFFFILSIYLFLETPVSHYLGKWWKKSPSLTSASTGCVPSVASIPSLHW